MGTIRTSIQMFNGMTPGLRSMTNALNIAISSFETMDRASSHCIDTSSLQAARAELNRAEVAFNQVESSIRGADEQQRIFNNDISHGTGLARGLRGMLAGIGGIMGIQKIVGISDEFSRSTARLSLMAGGLENVNEMQKQIYQSAQRTRTSYLGTMDAVAKLGLRAGAVFKNSNETIAFVEQLNRQFKIAGASQEEIASATLQLTQALGSGVLRGEEFNAVFEAAPNIMQSVAKYMMPDLPVEDSIGKLRDMAANGMITADIVKNAMFAAADETNERFNKIPHTWADVWIMSVNKVIKSSQPLLELIGFLANNWSMIEPIILGAVTALGLYFIATKGVAMAQAAFTATQTFLSIGFGILTGNTAAASAAMFTYNSSLLACPVTWVILAIIALVAIFYVAVAAVNKFKGTSISATGIIAGVFGMMVASVYNQFVFIWNFIAAFVNFLHNAFKNPTAAAQSCFYDMAVNVIGYIQTMAEAIENILNKIPGIEVSITSGLDRFKGSLQAKSKSVKDRAGFVDAMKTMEFKSYKDTYQKWYDKGAGFGDKMSGIFKGSDTPTPYDNMDQLIQNAGDTAGNTGRMADNMEIAEEDLKYLRDVAEREAINRFTTAEIKVDFKNEATIKSDMDIDGVINKFTDKLREAIYTEAEEVHVLV